VAALHRVIYPAAARHLTGTSRALRDQQERSRALALLVRRLHAQLSGDGSAAAEDVPSLRSTVLVALREHSDGERELTGLLRAALTAEQWQDVGAAYSSRLRSGPTRPHPHAPGTGLVGRLAYGMSAGSTGSWTSWTPASCVRSRPQRRPDASRKKIPACR
jgi:hypothetical protein